MKVLFIIPSLIISYKEFYSSPYVSLPLGVISMASFLRSVEWEGEIEVYDARLSAKYWRNTKGEEFFGDSDEEVKRFIKNSKADVIAISNMFTSQFVNSVRVAELAKESCNCVTVIGGPHISAFPEESIKIPSIDYVVMGEGEERFYFLLKSLKQGKRPEIQGVLKDESDMRLLRQNSKVRINFLPNIDTLPLPAYDLVDVERYFVLQSSGYSPRPREWGKRAVTLITSRGCPHQCIFCSIHATMGYKWRPHSVDYVMKHIQLLRSNYKIDFIHFEDDNFSHDPKRYDQILDGLLNLSNPPIPWDTPNGIRGDTWTRDRVQKTKASGCQYLTVAIESTSQRVIDEVVKKQLNLKQVSEFIAFCRQERLRMNALYVIGMPGEKFDEISGTVNTALYYYSKFGVWPILSIAMPLPGTELYEVVIKNKYYTSKDKYGYCIIKTQDFNPEMLNNLYRKFTRKKTLIFAKRSMLSLSEFIYNVNLVIKNKRNALRTISRGVRGIVD